MMWCQGWRRIGLYGWLLASLFGAGSAVAADEPPTLTLLTELWPPYVLSLIHI